MDSLEGLADSDDVRLHALQNAAGFATMAETLAAQDGPVNILYDPAAVGEQGKPRTFYLDKSATLHWVGEIRTAMTEESEIDADLRIWTAIDNITALLRGETTTEVTTKEE